MSFPKYPEYKDSGVEWLGEVPVHWSIPKLKHLARIRNGRDYKEVEADSGEYPVIGSGGEFSRASSYLYQGESVLLGRKGTIDKPLYINGPFWTVDTMFYTEISSKVSGRYLYYYATCFRFDQYSTNTALPSMAQEDLANIQLAVPAYYEQVNIAAFLDHETARIDVLVEEQQRLIELLKEKRQAVISHAVTKGFDPDVPMKDSGVEWLGEVPVHWEIMQFRRFTHLSQGLQIPQSERFYELGEGRVEYITIKSLNAGSSLEMREYIHKPSKRVLCCKEDVLLARTGATGQVVTDVEGAFHNNFFKVSYDEKIIVKDYLVFLLGVKELKENLIMLAGTTTIPDLNHGAFLSTKVPLPRTQEQGVIISACVDADFKYRSAVSECEKQIALLQERRSALISAAVTGKIDVRGWQPSEQPTATHEEATSAEAV